MVKIPTRITVVKVLMRFIIGEGTDEDYHKLCRNCCGVCANCCGNDSNRDCVLLGGLSSVKYLRLDPSYQMVCLFYHILLFT